MRAQSSLVRFSDSVTKLLAAKVTLNLEVAGSYSKDKYTLMSVARRLTTLFINLPSSAELVYFSWGMLTVYLLELMGVVEGLTVILKSGLEKTLEGMLTPVFHTL